MDPFFMRNLVYGTEDSLISTGGLLAGLAASGISRKDLIITGSILILVEALSMAFGSFLSEDTFMSTANMKHGFRDVVKYATVMFVSYILAGLVPMVPYMLAETPAHSIKVSVMLVLSALYLLVLIADKKEGEKTNHKRAVILTLTGGAILGTSIAVGSLLK